MVVLFIAGLFSCEVILTRTAEVLDRENAHFEFIRGWTSSGDWITLLYIWHTAGECTQCNAQVGYHKSTTLDTV